MKKLVLLSALVLSSTGASAHDLEANHFYDGMALSIEHFNADHSRDISSWGTEHRFMQDALHAVAVQHPQLKKAARLPQVPYDHNDPFRSFGKNFYLDRDLGARDLQDRIMSMISTCPYERVTTTTEYNLYRQSTTTETVTIYHLDRDNDHRTCGNTTASQLDAVGINQIKFIERDGWSNSLGIFMLQGSNAYRDMAFVKNQVAAINAELASIVAELPVLNFSGRNRIGAAYDIQLNGGTGQASFDDPILLTYWHGWGDCPAGCINNHTWDVKIEPTSTPDGYEFSVTITGESGDPLPTP